MKRDPGLWRRLEAFAFDAADAETPFSAKLAEEEGWTEAHAKAVVEEYRRFLYLACLAQDQVTPSEDVDRAWHLHLSYTRSYWDALCDRVLGRKLHHEPSKGASENPRFARQYQATQALYLEEFGVMPPASVWRTERAVRWYQIGRILGWIAVGIFALGVLAGPKSMVPVAFIFGAGSIF